jgi:hypothetical protein
MSESFATILGDQFVHLKRTRQDGHANMQTFDKAIQNQLLLGESFIEPLAEVLHEILEWRSQMAATPIEIPLLVRRVRDIFSNLRYIDNWFELVNPAKKARIQSGISMRYPRKPDILNFSKISKLTKQENHTEKDTRKLALGLDEWVSTMSQEEMDDDECLESLLTLVGFQNLDNEVQSAGLKTSFPQLLACGKEWDSPKMIQAGRVMAIFSDSNLRRSREYYCDDFIVLCLEKSKKLLKTHRVDLCVEANVALACDKFMETHSNDERAERLQCLTRKIFKDDDDLLTDEDDDDDDDDDDDVPVKNRRRATLWLGFGIFIDRDRLRIKEWLRCHPGEFLIVIHMGKSEESKEDVEPITDVLSYELELNDTMGRKEWTKLANAIRDEISEGVVDIIMDSYNMTYVYGEPIFRGLLAILLFDESQPEFSVDGKDCSVFANKVKVLLPKDSYNTILRNHSEALASWTKSTVVLDKDHPLADMGKICVDLLDYPLNCVSITHNGSGSSMLQRLKHNVIADGAVEKTGKVESRKPTPRWLTPREYSGFGGYVPCATCVPHCLHFCPVCYLLIYI